jgi:signal transduction histidine kinase
MSSSGPVVNALKDVGSLGAVTDRTLAVLRLGLSVSAFLIILIDPTEPSRLRNLTYFALVSYIVYSAAICLFSRGHRSFPFRVMKALTWVDVLWYSAFITLNAETNAVFFFFYLFAIIAGSSRGGTRLGLTLTAVCATTFLGLNILLVSQLDVDIARIVRRTVYMGALGSILAYWGGAEAMLRRRLTFLKELSLVGNPRFGADRIIRQMLRRLLDFHDADYCFFLIGSADGGLDFHRVAAASPEAESQPLKIGGHSGIPLMNISDPAVGAFVKLPWWRGRSAGYKAYDPATQEVTDLPAERAIDTAEMLNVRSFITAPLRYRERICGRILVGATQPGRFDIDDAAFLLQVADQVLPLIENIRLVDRLATGAAEEERRRIARSVHDLVVQPYLGLQIGIKALDQELSRATELKGLASAARATTLLKTLVSMTQDGVQELRQYVNGLRNFRGDETMLVDSIRRFSGKFESATGIHVDVVDNACGLTMNDRLSAEVFQLTAEALSNVHRHTHSRNAQVRLFLAENRLELSVENDASGALPAAFRPSSIIERAEALGARAEILWPEGKTLVRVEVPL